MVIKRKLPILLYIILFIGFWTSLSAQDLNHGWNGVIIKVISPEVSVIREGSLLSLYEWGMTLYEKDEIQTGKNGKATIRFSSAKSGNEVILGPSTRVRISRTAANVDYSIYQISVIEGKIFAKDLPIQNRKVQVRAGLSNILPFGGEYVVEQSDAGTLTANTKGNVRILDPSSKQYTSIPAGEIASVSGKSGELTILSIPEQLMSDFSSTTALSNEAAPKIHSLVDDRKTQVASMVNARLETERIKEEEIARARELAKAKEIAAQPTTQPR